MKTSEELLAKEAAFDGDGRFELADSDYQHTGQKRSQFPPRTRSSAPRKQG